MCLKVLFTILLANIPLFSSPIHPVPYCNQVITLDRLGSNLDELSLGICKGYLNRESILTF